MRERELNQLPHQELQELYLKDTQYNNTVNSLVDLCYGASKASGWWTDIDQNDLYIIATKLCLIHSEISEAMEGARKGLMDDHLPERTMLEVELADALIRIFDLAGALELDLGGALEEKVAYNQKRAQNGGDHSPEARGAEGGKKF
jgi:NTP pyrophosphatase (non-canonical NTP hydrolase)